MGPDLQAFVASGKGENCSLVDVQRFIPMARAIGFVTDKVYAVRPGGFLESYVPLDELKDYEGFSETDQLFYNVHYIGAGDSELHVAARSLKTLEPRTPSAVHAFIAETVVTGDPNSAAQITATVLRAFENLPGITEFLKKVIPG